MKRYPVTKKNGNVISGTKPNTLNRVRISRGGRSL